MSDEKEFIGAAMLWGSFMTMLTGFIGYVSGKQTDKKIVDYDKLRKEEEAAESSEQITILRGLQDKLNEMDKNQTIAHTELKTEVKFIKQEVSAVKAKTTDLYVEKEALGNRITALENRQ
jgi:hypothetical protein